MTHRERIMAVIEGRQPDRLPFVPRLEIWYNAHKAAGTLPGKYKGKSIEEIQKMLGVGNSARDFKLYNTSIEGVEISDEIKGTELKRTYSTPRGSVYETYRLNPEAAVDAFKDRGLPAVEGEIDSMIKDVADYKVVEYIVENTKFTPDYQGYVEYNEKIGDSGMPMIFCGWDPMFKIMHDYIGYNNIYYEMADNLEEVEHLYHVMWDKYRELHEILVKSPMEMVLHGSHYDSMMTPPPLYDKYIMPYMKELSNKLHAEGKILTVHADADSKLLLNNYLESGIDMVECFCTHPLVSVTMKAALDAFKGNMIIWGGIPSTLLVPLSTPYEEFTDYMNNLFKLLKRKDARVILGIADNVMPEADMDRVEKVCEMADNFRY